MRNRGARPLKELYDLTDRIKEPEITPVLEGNCRIQGPVDDPDHNHLKPKLGILSGEKRNTFVDVNHNLRVESGTCNVCSAPCSSCMHLNRTASVMESKVESTLSGNAFRRKESDSCSFNGIEELPLYKKRTCDNKHQAHSETSNLFSTSSSHDSYSENAESKAPKGSVFHDASDAVDMPLKDLEDAAVGADELFPGKTNVTAPNLISSDKQNASDLCRKKSVNQDEDHRGSECHGDNVSCITGAKDANVAVVDSNKSLIKKDVTCSTVSTSCVLAIRDTSMVQVVAARVFHDEINENHINFRRPNNFQNIEPMDLEGKEGPEILLETFECKMKNTESSLKPLSSEDIDKEKAQTSVKNFEDGKEIPMVRGNSSVALNVIEVCLETSTDNDVRISSNVVGSSNEQPEAPNLVVEAENSELDGALDDVKVCDICGDTGREDLLAICSRCSDGAEHTYCMRNMLDKLPEGNWLCEECKSKDDENRRADKSKEVSGNLLPACSIDNSHTSIKAPIVVPKLDIKPVQSEARGVIKGKQTTQVLSAKQEDNLINGSNSSKKAVEMSGGFIGAASSKGKTGLSRESSFKNMDTGKVKQFSKGGSNPQTFSRLLLASGSKSFKAQAPLHSPRVPFSRSSSFDNSNLKPSFKAKQTLESVPQKQLGRESTSFDPRKAKPISAMAKSASFKRSSSGISSIMSIGKSHSLNQSQGEDPSCLKQVKGKNLIENKKPSAPDRSLVCPSLTDSGTPVLQLDLTVAQLDDKLKNTTDSKSSGISEGSDDTNNNGYKEAKKPPIGLSKKPATQFTDSMHDSEGQKSYHVSKGIVHVSKSSTKPEKILERRITETAGLANHDDNVKESTLPSNLKKTVSGGKKTVHCKKCNETGHTSQFCPVDAIGASTNPSIKKGSKLKDAVEAANLSSRKNNRLPDECKDHQMPSADSSCRAACKDSLPCHGESPLLGVITRNMDFSKGPASENKRETNSVGVSPLSGVVTPNLVTSKVPTPESKKETALLGDSPLLGVIVHNPEGTKVSSSDYRETAPTAKRLKGLQPMEPFSFSSAIDSKAVLTISDESYSKSSIQIFPDKSSIPVNLLKASAIPELEFIWQGLFEVQRTGVPPRLFDGIQAHLSTYASPKVLETMANLPSKFQLEEVPRISSWPLQFQMSSPKEDNIALFFFAKDIESYEKNYLTLLEKMLLHDLALKGNINGVELLIFPSNKLAANFQRWNNLFFLWGVFRGRVPNCLEGPSGFPDQTVSSIPSKDSMIPPVDAKLPVCDRSSKLKAVMANSSIESLRISTLGVGDKPFRSEFTPVFANSLHQSDSKLSAEITSLPTFFPLRSTNQQLDKLDARPESSLLSPTALCQEGTTAAINLINTGSLSEGIEVEPLHPINANKADAGPKSIHTSVGTSNSVQGEIISEEKMTHKAKPIKSEAAEQEIPTETRPDRKRPNMCSTEVVSPTAEQKKMKLSGEGDLISGEGDLRDESLTAASSSIMRRVLDIDLNEECGDDVPSESMIQEPRGTEKCFFPLDLDPLRHTGPNNIINLSSDDEGSPESSVPQSKDSDLELALCVKRNSTTQILPLPFALPDGQGNMNKPPGLVAEDVSLSLSLGLPTSRATPFLKMEPLSPERPDVSTTLFL